MAPAQRSTRLLERALARAADLGERLSGPLAADARAQAAGLREIAHRPWPPLAGPSAHGQAGRWLQGRTWREVLFADWPLPAEALRPAVPAELPIDTFDGMAWLGV